MTIFRQFSQIILTKALLYTTHKVQYAQKYNVGGNRLKMETGDRVLLPQKGQKTGPVLWQGENGKPECFIFTIRNNDDKL